MSTKGAPDELLQVSDKVLIDGEVVPLTDEIREFFAQENGKMADQALRVLGVAVKDFDTKPKNSRSKTSRP